MKLVSIYYLSFLICRLLSMTTITQARLGEFLQQHFFNNDRNNSTDEETQQQHPFLQHAKLFDFDETNEKMIRNEIIVVFNNKFMNQRMSVLQNVQAMIEHHGGQILQVYDSVFKGVAIRGMPRTKIGAFLNSNKVQFASMNENVTLGNTQPGAGWNLDRIDQASLPLDGQYTYHRLGTGVRAYILDTGIRVTHSEFSGRASCGFSAFPNEGSHACDDLHGHGTHVAGTIGGATYGVAKNVNLVSVKVISGSGAGSWTEILSGLDYIVKEKQKNPSVPMVINLSLAGPKSAAMNEAINSVVNAGITVVVAAGNSNQDACSFSPASADRAITVGAFDTTDKIATFSNEGNCVDIYAPGTDIISASPADDNASMSLSGTSMASPAVVGVIALLLEQFPNASPDEVWSKIRDDSLKDKVQAQSIGEKSLTNTNVGTASTTNDNDVETASLASFFSRWMHSILAPVPPPPPPPAPEPQSIMLYKNGNL